MPRPGEPHIVSETHEHRYTIDWVWEGSRLAIARENMAKFLTWLKAVVPSESLLFEPDDVIYKRNTQAIISALLWIKNNSYFGSLQIAFEALARERHEQEARKRQKEADEEEQEKKRQEEKAKKELERLKREEDKLKREEQRQEKEELARQQEAEKLEAARQRLRDARRLSLHAEESKKAAKQKKEEEERLQKEREADRARRDKLKSSVSSVSAAVLEVQMNQMPALKNILKKKQQNVVIHSDYVVGINGAANFQAEEKVDVWIKGGPPLSDVWLSSNVLLDPNNTDGCSGILLIKTMLVDPFNIYNYGFYEVQGTDDDSSIISFVLHPDSFLLLPASASLKDAMNTAVSNCRVTITVYATIDPDRMAVGFVLFDGMTTANGSLPAFPTPSCNGVFEIVITPSIPTLLPQTFRRIYFNGFGSEVFPILPRVLPPGQIEVVLRWDGAVRVDLDLHLYSNAGNHCYFSNKTVALGDNGQYTMTLDKDDQSSGGPETMRFTLQEKTRYCVAVHHYGGGAAAFNTFTAITCFNFSGSVNERKAPNVQVDAAKNHYWVVAVIDSERDAIAYVDEYSRPLGSQASAELQPYLSDAYCNDSKRVWEPIRPGMLLEVEGEEY